MKRILIVSVGVPTGEAMKSEVDAIFHEYAQTEYCLCHQLEARFSGQDIVLYSSRYCEDACRSFSRPGTTTLSARRVIDYRNIREVIELEPGTPVLLVNDCRETAAEAIDQLVEIGLDHIQYLPSYPGSPAYPNIDMAITPGEPAFVPAYVRRVIDIGIRGLDIQTIYDLMRLLDAEQLFTQSLVARYLREIVSVSKSFSDSCRNMERSEKMLETILSNVDCGVAYIGTDHRIIRANPTFEEMFGRNKEQLCGEMLERLLGRRTLPGDSFVAPVRAKQILFHVKRLEDHDLPALLITADYADAIHKMDRRIQKDSHSAVKPHLYRFEDYLTWDDGCRDMLALARKFARASGSVLIQGESGTGKEILAQSIHSASARRDRPFIPVNIASLTSTLAESELFGYEDASFTGARKGGKAGIFERADGGTVFIDEIGEASPELQAKLLRALEEKSIRRVGGTEEIPVQVSVIAATNRDLPTLIRQGRFREDLFFRLNMFPLQTIPLRRRQGDILPLLRHFLEAELDPPLVQTLLGSELTSFFLEYPWFGNVRELMNTAEYIKLTHEGQPLLPENLPAYMRTPAQEGQRVFLSELEYHVLHAIAACNGHRVGRNRLQALLSDDGITLGTGKIRSILKHLEEQKLIVQDASGCTLTLKGNTAL